MKMPATTVVRGAPACTHWFRRRQETWVGIAPSRWLPLAFVVLATAAGAQTEQLLHSFRTFDSGSSPSYNGYPLVLPNGHVVGTALYGSSAVGEGNGVVFQLVPPTKTDPNWAYHVIHRFAGGADGAVPYGGLTLGANGILYGMTSEGGAANCGVVYQMTPPAQSPTGTWEEVVLYSFQASNPADGCYPWNTQLLYDSSTGSLYGTTSGGGLYNESGYMGIIFRLDPPAEAGGSWTETILYSFTRNADGAWPSGTLAGDPEGVIYGTNAAGVVWSYNTSTGALSTVYTFQGGTDGALPYGGVIGPFPYSDQPQYYYLLGTTFAGGGSTNCEFVQPGCGTVFAINLPFYAGQVATDTILHAFDGTDGNNPETGLARIGSAAWGTTGGCAAHAGASQCGTLNYYGTLFKVQVSGTTHYSLTYEPVYSFVGGGLGGVPETGLAGDTAGNIIGMTEVGGAWGGGTVYEWVP